MLSSIFKDLILNLIEIYSLSIRKLSMPILSLNPPFMKIDMTLSSSVTSPADIRDDLMDCSGTGNSIGFPWNLYVTKDVINLTKKAKAADEVLADLILEAWLGALARRRKKEPASHVEFKATMPLRDKAESFDFVLLLESSNEKDPFLVLALASEIDKDNAVAP